MPVGTLIGAGFVRIDADTAPAMKAVKGLGQIGAHALASAFLPVQAAVAAGAGAMAASLAAAGAAGGAFAAAVKPQFAKITEASEKLQAAEDANEKVTLAKAHAQKLAKDMGVKYGQQIKITKDMSEGAKEKAQEYNKALGEVTSATDVARKSQAIYDEKMKAMTPATRETAKSFQGLKDDIDKWSDSLSGTTMPIFTAGIEKIRDLLPKLTPFVRIGAREIKEFASSFGEGQAGRVFKEFGANLQGNAGSALGNFLTSIRNVTVGVVGMINAFMPVQSQMSGGMVELTQRFADFGANLGDSEGFATFLERARGAVPAIKEFAAALGDIASAAGPLGGMGLMVLQLFSQLVAAIPTPVLRLLVPAILAVNAAMKLYAIYQAAAAAATWAFGTSVAASNGAVASSRAALLWFRIQQAAYAVSTAASTAATWAFTAASRAAALGLRLFTGVLRLARAAVLLTAGAMRALAVAMLTNPVGLIITALVALGAAFFVAWKKSETFRNGVKAALNWVKDVGVAVGGWFAGPFVRFFTETIPGAFRSLLNWVQTKWNALVSLLTVPVETAVRYVLVRWDLLRAGLALVWELIKSKVLTPISNFFTKTIPGWAVTLVSLVVGHWYTLRDRLVTAYTSIKNRIFTPISNFFTKTIPGWAVTLVSLVITHWYSLRDKLAVVYASIKSKIFTPISNFFTKTIPGWAVTLRTKVVNTWGSLRNGLYDVYTSIKNRVFTPISNFFTKTIPGWARTLRDRVKGYFREMRDGIGTIWAGIKSKTKAPVNWVLDRVWNRGLVSVWGKIAGWVGLRNSLKSVKLLASGGTVGRAQPGMFNKPTAIVGEGNPRYPEYVIPTDPKYATRARGLWQAAGAHFMADGGILGSIKGAIGSVFDTGKSLGKAALGFLSNPVGKAKDLLMGPLRNITRAIGSSSWARMVARLPRMAVDGLIKAVKSVGSDLLGFGGGGGNVDIGGSGVKRWTGVVRQALGLVGQPAAYTGITLRRMNQESGGNPRAVNLWDINAKRGYPSVGLMQVIRPTFQAHAGRFRRTGPFMYGTSINPLANVYASMRYALAAYGSLPRAYNRPGGYALGTDGASAGWHWVGEMGPELLKLPAGARVRSHRASARQAATAPTVVHLTVENHGVIGSRQQTLDWLVGSLEQLDRRSRLPRAMGGRA
ncbi:transglycosylase SLT domain-containing protein [Streptomyces sp. NRRL S-455]|uniref:transglycosylase SLT domain-containing protein n=1 Tax=Streptomyces sp. NRRL S-455 TaxID=1463908 RepID=UPI0004BE6468|nr:transglycosylase SLT domain-containing protein [Streptomyces sp. NRRL S-455]